MAVFHKIGVLTSGGDAPGMNAAIKAVVDRAYEMNIEVVGIVGGYSGLMAEPEPELESITPHTVANIIGQGGTILYSSRCLEFATPEGVAKAVRACKKVGIDALICIGGDGTYGGAYDMTKAGIPCIGLPGTIDNDISATDYTIGFDTALNTTVDLIDHLRDTCESHARLNVVEVMGRNCGLIALYAAVASGAVAVAVPELPFDEESCLRKIRALRDNPKGHKRSMIVVVSEGMPQVNGRNYGEYLRERIQTETGVESKYAQFAHVVRGGKPSLKDRFIASEMGVRAVELLVAGHSSVAMCEIDGKVVATDINFVRKTDRMYKNKLKPGDLDGFSEAELAGMKALVEKRQEECRRLATIAESVSL